MPSCNAPKAPIQGNGSSSFLRIYIKGYTAVVNMKFFTREINNFSFIWFNFYKGSKKGDNFERSSSKQVKT